MTTSFQTTIPVPTNPLLAERLERLRLQVVASELATLVGRNIKAARLEKGIRTQRELGEKIREVEPEMAAGNTRVSIWERGAETPSDRYLQALSQVLDKTADWFYTDHRKEQKTPDLLAVPSPEPLVGTQLNRIEEDLAVILGVLEQQVGADVVGAVREERRLARESVPSKHPRPSSSS